MDSSGIKPEDITTFALEDIFNAIVHKFGELGAIIVNDYDG